MTIYAYNPKRQTAFVYRIDCDDIIYERAYHLFGGWDGETEHTSSTKEELILGLLEDGFILGTEETYVFD